MFGGTGNFYKSILGCDTPPLFPSPPPPNPQDGKNIMYRQYNVKKASPMKMKNYFVKKN
jgi:hypothetical protein